MRRLPFSPFFACLLSLTLTHPLLADSVWPQHRGPSQDGSVRGSDLIPRAGIGLELAWKLPLGVGYSGISIADGKAVTLFSDGTNDVAGAFDATTGSPLWRYTIAPMYAAHDGSLGGPLSSPLLHEGVAYGLGPHGKLFALRLSDGSELWSRQLDREKEAREPYFGFTTSPMLVGEALIVLTGHAEGRLVSAYSRRDGSFLWSSGNDSAGYQTPLLTEIGGRRQLLIASNRDLSGLDPSTGRVLWSKRRFEEEDDGFAQPVALGSNRFLLSEQDGATAYELRDENGAMAAHELWKSSDLKSSYAIPVVHGGYLYGFSGRFLVCVDASTGKTAWKSRPPGGRGIILVEDHLVILGTGGELVMAEASPQGYAEKARLKILDADSITPPSFAAGRVYVRNETEIASVRIAAASGAVAPKNPGVLDVSAVGGSFGLALTEIDRAPATDKARRLDALLAAHPSGPIVDPSGRTHFWYRGDVRDVAVVGSVLGVAAGEERALARLPGTDLFVLSLDLCPRCVYDYGYRIDFGDPQPDATNPWRFSSPPLQLSELRMPGWNAPAHVEEPKGARGRLEEVTFSSTIRAGERKLQVYLPPGYESGDQRYPLVIVFNGDRELAAGRFTNTLDNLIGASIRPLIAVFVPRTQEYAGAPATDFARAINEELVPWLDGKYRTTARPADRAVLGNGAGAVAAVLAAFQPQGAFGGLAVQSLFQSPEAAEKTKAAIASAPKRDLRIYLEESDIDITIPAARIDAKTDTRTIKELLLGQGYDVRVNAVAGAPGWLHWRAQNGVILEQLFPLR